MVTLTISIITRNRKEMLKRCLLSILEKIKDIDMELIVVDNNSLDGTVGMIKDEFKSVELIVNETNTGIARARNQVMDIYKGKYLLILDDDTKIISTNFIDLINYMEEHDRVGVVGSSILTPENCVYPSARNFPLPLNILAKRLSFIPFIKNSDLMKPYRIALECNDEPRESGFVIGAFMLIRGEAQKQVGELDGRMIYGFEDADFCARMKMKNFVTIYYPKFSIIHYKGTVSDRVFSKYLLYFIGSYFLCYIKHRKMLKGG